MGVVIGIEEGSFSGDKTLTGTGKQSAKTSYQVTFHVMGLSIDETWAHVLSDTDGLPQLYEDWNHDGCRCKKIALKDTKTIRTDGELTYLWYIECSFDSDTPAGGGGGEGSGSTDPTQWPTTLRITSEDMQEDVSIDPVSGNPITNPNGEPYNITRDASYPVIEFSRYENMPNTLTGLRTLLCAFTQYANTCNSTPFLGFPVESCLMRAPQIERELINGKYYFKVTYRILVKNNGELTPFAAKPLCEGYLVKDPEKDYAIVSTSELYGKDISVSLAANGTALADGDDPVYESFYRYKQSDWDALRLYPTEIIDKALEKAKQDKQNGSKI